jgi:hypothetical protein
VVAEVTENKDAAANAKKNQKGVAKKETDTGESSDIFKLVKMVVERNFDPVRRQKNLIGWMVG